MTFLQLFNEYQTLWSDVAAVEVADIPSTGAEQLRLVMHLQAAYDEIQTSQNNWGWLRKEVSVTIADTENTGDVTDTDLDDFDPRGFQGVYVTATGVSDISELTVISYQEMTELKSLDPTVTGRPQYIARIPEQQGETDTFEVYPISNGAYTLQLDYYQLPQQLALKTDVPLIPSRFHRLIIYKAWAKYGMFEESDNTVKFALSQADRLYNDLLWATQVIDNNSVVEAD